VRVPEYVPAVKEPGDYTEVLHDWLVDEFDAMETWLRWNGYASYEVLKRDRHRMLTLNAQRNEEAVDPARHQVQG
jgi:hypothetical protein